MDELARMLIAMLCLFGAGFVLGVEVKKRRPKPQSQQLGEIILPVLDDATFQSFIVGSASLLEVGGTIKSTRNVTISRGDERFLLTVERLPE